MKPAYFPAVIFRDGVPIYPDSRLINNRQRPATSSRRSVADTDRLLLVAGAEHPAARDLNFTVDRFTTGPWIGRERGSSMRQDFEILLIRFGVDPSDVEIALEHSNETVRQAVVENACVTSFPTY